MRGRMNEWGTGWCSINSGSGTITPSFSVVYLKQLTNQAYGWMIVVKENVREQRKVFREK